MFAKIIVFAKAFTKVFIFFATNFAQLPKVFAKKGVRQEKLRAAACKSSLLKKLIISADCFPKTDGVRRCFQKFSRKWK